MTLRLVLLVVAASTATATASDITALRRGSPCEWDALFRSGSGECAPQGATVGTVLHSTSIFPKLKARVQGTVWRGKTFHSDGTFVNRWIGFEAISATFRNDVSRLDGLPCISMQYGPDQKVFPCVRDELRQIDCRTWIGRGYDGKTGELNRYFVLQLK